MIREQFIVYYNNIVHLLLKLHCQFWLFFWDFSSFTEQLDIIRNRHSRVVETMAEGIKEFKEESDYDSKLENFMDNIIQYFLDRFYMNRISIRTLIHQHSKC